MCACMRYRAWECMSDWMCVVLLLVKQGQVQEVHKHTTRGQSRRHSIKHSEGNWAAGLAILSAVNECGE